MLSLISENYGRGKFSLIQPNNAWRSGFQDLIMTQLNMERTWDQMKDKDGFVMKKVNVSTLGDHEADEADSVKIVVISDTHGVHERLTVPSGRNGSLSVNNIFLPQVIFSSMLVTSQSTDLSLRLSPSMIGWPHCLTR